MTKNFTEKFGQRMALNGGEAVICENHDMAAKKIVEFALKEKAGGGSFSFYLSKAIKEPLRAKIKEAVSGDEGFAIEEKISDGVNISIAPAAAVLVEDGALVVDAAAVAHEETLFGDISVLIADRVEIYNNMIDFFAAVASGKSPVKADKIVLIAGPSKTADIEKQIVTGMHGPKKLLCFLIE